MTMSKQTAATMILFLAVGAASFPRAASGQLPVAGTTALATANNYTALARGFTAIALNPAGLGMPGNPGFSLALLPIEGRAGLSGLTLGEIAEYSDLPLSHAKREEWLQRVEEEGAFTTRAGVSGTALALSAGPVGFQISSVGQSNTAMTPDAFELALFGNSGRTGTPRDMTLDSTAIDGWWASTAAFALGIPLPDFQGGSFSAGVTLKYTVGHVVVTGDDAGSVIDGVPVNIGLSIPSIAPDSTLTFDNGTGLGMDLGLAWQDSTWAASVSVQNVFNSFQWNLEGLAYRPGVFIANVDSISSDFDAVPATSAPMALQDSVLAQRFEPTFTLGLAYRHSDKLALTADLHHDSGDALVFGGSHIGLGVEFRALPILPLRGGLSSVSGGGVQFAVGFGLALGPVNLSGAYLTETGSPGEYKAASFALSYGHN